MKISVLGAGMVGSAMAIDLAKEESFHVTAVDKNHNSLTELENNSPVHTLHADLQDPASIVSAISKSDLVICAVPGFMGFRTLKSIIEAGKNVVDISFFGEDPFELDNLAKSKEVTAVVDCGVAPGLCNVIAGYLYDLLDETDRYLCYVGGLPQVRQWPFEYKAAFSPSDVLEEYTRPARYVEYGEEVVRPALSDIELITLPEVGSLEAFNTDGLRSLAKTLNIPFMREKTLRYPGHAELLRVFRESGFLETTPIEVDGQMVTPLAMTSKLLFKQWRLGKGEADFTVMQVIIEGKENGMRKRYTYDLLDKYNEVTQTTSMARTTGYTGTIIARQVLNGMFSQKGICPPEYIGRTRGCYEHLLDEYKKRNIRLVETITDQSKENLK